MIRENANSGCKRKVVMVAIQFEYVCQTLSVLYYCGTPIYFIASL
jgi:hypothetical protein